MLNFKTISFACFFSCFFFTQSSFAISFQGKPQVSTKKIDQEQLKSQKKLNDQGVIIYLNAASFDELIQLKGVGPKKAELIIAEREKKKFSNFKELEKIKGFTEKGVEKILNLNKGRLVLN